MAFEFRLPDIGEGVIEGEVVRWMVKEGEVIREDQPMVEVMTDKATVEIPSPRAGRVARIAAPEGKMCAVGQVMVVIDDAAGTRAGASGAGGSGGGVPTLAQEERQVTERLPATRAQATEPGAAPPHGTPAPAEASGGNGAAARAPDAASGGKVLAAPATRKLARDLGVELARVRGTGDNGRVTQDDVRAAAGQPAAQRRERSAVATGATGDEAQRRASARGDDVQGRASARGDESQGRASARGDDAAERGDDRGGDGRDAPSGDSGRDRGGAVDERIPFRGVRKKIAENMARSRRTAAHFTYVEEADVTELVALRARAKRRADERGLKLSFLPFIVKAVVAGLKKYPIVNSTLDEERGEIVLRHRYHIGVAAASEAGLIVPVVKDADRKSLFDIARELADLSEKAKAGKATRDELTGSTFTISSLGALGGVLATPIINHPEVAILGVHKIKQAPVVRDGSIVIRDVTNFSVSLDHRVVDGYEGALFLQHVISLLEDPTLMFMELV